MDTVIEDHQGRIVARFSGRESPLSVIALATANEPRARIFTGDEENAFAIDGYVTSSRLPWHVAEDVAVVPEHVWIPAGSRVDHVVMDADGIRVTKRLEQPFTEELSGLTSCHALGFSPPPISRRPPPPMARGFAWDRAELPLFADRGGTTAIFTLNRDPTAPSVLLLGELVDTNWIRIRYEGDIIIDAWVKRVALRSLPKGELMDQAPSHETTADLRRLGVPRHLQKAITTRNVPLYGTPVPDAVPIGWIAPNTPTLIVDRVAAWASVLPESLVLIPPEGGAFWVRNRDLVN